MVAHNSIIAARTDNKQINTHRVDTDLQQTIESLISKAINAGADFVEFFIESTDNLSLLAEQDEITNVSPSFSSGAGIRVFKGLQDGFVSTNDISPYGLLQSLEKALSILNLNQNLTAISPFEGLNTINDYSINKYNWINECPHISEISDKLLLGTKYLGTKAKHVQVRRASYSRSWQQILVAASDGTFSKDIRLHQSTGLNILVADGIHRSSIGRRYGSYGHTDDIKIWNPELSAEDISLSSAAMLYADYVEAGQKPVIMANKFGGVIFHEACGHLLETTQIERGTSPFSEKKGEKIANSSVTAIDEGITEKAFGTISIDDEGMEPQRTTLIENGILRNFLSDRAGSLRTGHPRTGSGRRQSHSFPAASRMRNTFIAAGKYHPNQLIESVDDGLYCKSMGGGSVGPTGQFNFAVEEGYLIKNGKLTKPVKGATLIGEAKEVLPKISMCANDLELAPGFCGSVSGSINVTVGQPHIKVDSITIGGR